MGMAIRATTAAI